MKKRNPISALARNIPNPIPMKITDEFQPVTSILEFQMYQVISRSSHGMTKNVPDFDNLGKAG
jgi:hypothetical protein